MWTSTFLFLLYFLTVSYVFSDATYECGDHGKFEYCIDEILGCVIGCHCHPGYYFDTDTKICEPNSKLIEHHRRHYADGQSSIQSIVTTPFTMFEIDPVNSSKINSKVDEIRKDANDLGDWLYNQFFKTIENQVINNTSDSDILTRRSGSRQTIGKLKKKKGANIGKIKQRKKKQDLKKKLLRITENDSLFDMTSRSDSDSSADSSSDSSFEYERRDDHHDSDDEHGHKKIVMINKKPKPALPSFIFLPNMDTPFYPPIGLPPPPVVPMYPIVPVPPVVPFCVTTDCISDEGKTTSSPTITTTVTTESELTKTPTVQNTDKVTLTEINEPTAPTNISLLLRLPGKKRKKEPRFIENDENNENINNFGVSNLKPSTRQKFLKRLKERMNNPSAKFLMSPWKKNKQKLLETFVKDRNNDASIFENALLDDSYLANNIQDKAGRDEAPPENVDFKYITELIHKVNLKNKSNDLPPIEYSPSNSIEMYQPQFQQNQFSDYIMPPNAPDGRRYNRPGNQQSEDSYYMKLGREIASMIRGIDEQNRKVSLKLEGSRANLKNDIYFNENSPRSYWERSVRSPLTFLKSNKSKFEYLKRSNELLFDIENKVEIVASTRPTLSLQEIENIVKVIETNKREIHNKESSNKNILALTNNLNIKLWPQELRDPNKVLRNSIPNNLDKKQITSIQNPERNKSNVIHQISDIPKDTRGIRMQNIHKFVVWRKPTSNGDMEPEKMTDIKSKMESEVKSFLTNPSVNYNKRPPYEVPNHKQVEHVPVSKDNFKQSLMEGNMGSFFLKHRKYFDNNQNYFVNQPSLITGNTQRSYFHHEIDNFDYVD